MGKIIPFSYMDTKGKMQFYELNEDSKIEVTFLDYTKKIMTPIELIKHDKSIPSKPSAIVLSVKVL